MYIVGEGRVLELPREATRFGVIFQLVDLHRGLFVNSLHAYPYNTGEVTSRDRTRAEDIANVQIVCHLWDRKGSCVPNKYIRLY